MDLQQRLMAEIKEAMKAKAAERLGALRLILNALKEREINARGTDAVLGDELAVLARMVKQRQESVKVYLEGGRPELAAKETAEIAVIEGFLPKQLTAEEVEAVVTSAIAEVGATSVKDMGRVMAVLKAGYTGQMDFGAVGALIKGKL
ncbi:GatB/YqeY domain-containing protein [Rhodobacter sp. KR11]|uniref:GatB/YqeY domain-containing protein n=1 Tax=Rhodobacter sp. KR11 TaxID=2974588 RepID=UPI002221CA43|nr:GatB/YqeY domain-containing protein [Rhodobacter sp. KR11]MCW1920688.1 GatB/YqeY domain-containing protein [Rhodobacter sp. KR11]